MSEFVVAALLKVVACGPKTGEAVTPAPATPEVVIEAESVEAPPPAPVVDVVTGSPFVALSSDFALSDDGALWRPQPIGQGWQWAHFPAPPARSIASRNPACVQHRDASIACYSDSGYRVDPGRGSATDITFDGDVLAIEDGCALFAPSTLVCSGDGSAISAHRQFAETYGAMEGVRQFSYVEYGYANYLAVLTGEAAHTYIVGDDGAMVEHDEAAFDGAAQLVGASTSLCARFPDGSARCRRFRDDPRQCDPEEWDCADYPVEGVVGARQLVFDGDYGCAVTEDDRATCWWEEYRGERQPARDVGLAEVRDIALMDPLVCALLTDGTIVCRAMEAIMATPTGGWSALPRSVGE